MTTIIRPIVSAAGGICAAACVALGLMAAATLSPAEAKSYAERGAWEGSVYVSRPVTAKRAAYSKTSVKRSGTAQKSYKKGKRYAALGKTANDASPYKKSVTGGRSGGVRWVANAGCAPGSLRSVVQHVAANYGSVTVSSTCRSKGHNAAVGGAKKSQHLTGSAIDFRVHGNYGAAYAYLRNSGAVGGLKHYGGGLFHIDTGPRRAF